MTRKTTNCAFPLILLKIPAGRYSWSLGILIGILSLLTFPFFFYTQLFGFGFRRRLGM